MQDFSIWIGPSGEGDPSTFPVHVFRAPAGPARGSFQLDPKLLGQLELVCQKGDDFEARREFGTALFGALFSGPVRDRWMQSRARASNEDLRLLLWIEPPRLRQVPWELLYDDGGFLAADASLSVVRYLPSSEPPATVGRYPARILVVIQSMADPQPLNDGRLLSALEAIEKSSGGRIQVTLREDLPASALPGELDQGHQVLLLLCHGRPGLLRFPRERDAPAEEKRKILGDWDLGQLVRGHRELRLAVVCACASGEIRQADLFSGIGPALVQAGVPVVAAMQYDSVTLGVATRFSEALVTALVKGEPVDRAIGLARQSLTAARALGGREWSTPVLYVGTQSRRSLEFVEADTLPAHLVQVASETPSEPQAAAEAIRQLGERVRALGDQVVFIQGLLEAQQAVDRLHSEYDELARMGRDGEDVPLRMPTPRIRSGWSGVRGSALPPVQRAANRIIERLSDASWIQGLEREAGKINQALADMALRDLAKALVAFGQQVAEARSVLDADLASATREADRLQDQCRQMLPT